MKPVNSSNHADIVRFSQSIRRQALDMVYRARASHIGSCFSIADILAVLYCSFLRLQPRWAEWPDRDRFVLSKGHAAAIVYATLAERGFFPAGWLEEYCQDGARLAGHITSHEVPGVEVSTGSLGHGLSIACGLAIASRSSARSWRTITLLSDGELDEGSVWEAILFAGFHRLDRLIAVVDYNKLQSFGTVSSVLDLAPLADKWASCHWHVQEVDGHDHRLVRKALDAADADLERPSVIIAHTTKGKGVDFMENQIAWHYRSPNEQEYLSALVQLGGMEPSNA